MKTFYANDECKCLKPAANDNSFFGLSMPFAYTDDASQLPVIGEKVPPNRISGFTLIELMIGVVILGVLAAVAVPNMQDFVRRNRVASQINEILSDLTYTRTEAIKRNTNVTMCSSNDQATCTSSNWKQGWIVLAGTNVLRMNPGLSGGNIVTTTGTGQFSITYAASGTNSGSITGIKICDDANKYGRRLAFSAVGLSMPNSVPAACP